MSAPKLTQAPAHKDLPAHSCAPFTPDEHARGLRLANLIDLLDYYADVHMHAGNRERMLVLGERVGRVADTIAREWAHARSRAAGTL